MAFRFTWWWSYMSSFDDCKSIKITKFKFTTLWLSRFFLVIISCVFNNKFSKTFANIAIKSRNHFIIKTYSDDKLNKTICRSVCFIKWYGSFYKPPITVSRNAYSTTHGISYITFKFSTSVSKLLSFFINYTIIWSKKTHGPFLTVCTCKSL